MSVLALAGVVAAPSALGVEEAQEATEWMGQLDRRIGEVVSPGALARAHAHLEGASNCTSCHAGLDATPDSLCLECHDEVRKRIGSEVGWHATFEGRCTSCHTDHLGRRANLMGLHEPEFNHERAAFPLRGAHVRVDCNDCHRFARSDVVQPAFHPLGVSFAACGDCHEKVHESAFPAELDCGDCHSERSFRAADLAQPSAFDHRTHTSFPLDARHQQVSCDGCHREELHQEPVSGLRPGTEVDPECRSCHEDPHEGSIAGECGECHGAGSWTLPGFDHSERTEFPLDETHEALDCSLCHADLSLQAVGSKCVECHTDAQELLTATKSGSPTRKADPHSGELGCPDCHPPELAHPTRVDYAEVCTRCHPAAYGSLLLDRKRTFEGLQILLQGVQGDEASARAQTSIDPELRELVSLLARTGAHNPELAETWMRALQNAQLRAKESR